MIRRLALLALAGCVKRPPELPPFSWSDTPRLPAPSAGSYAAVPSRPDDRGIAEVMGERAWDGSLAGAATGLGLDLVDGRGALTSPEVREAAWRAGWPFPIARAEAWPVQIGSAPPAQVGAWLAAQPPEFSIGLVRVRGSGRDLWVGLASPARRDLGVVPRQLPRGGQLLLPAVPGARATLADPDGNLLQGELHTAWSTTVETSGEWLVEIRDDVGPVATFPVYVGLVPPDLSLLIPGDPPVDEREATLLVDQRLAEIRDAYGLRPFEADPLLAAAARRAAEEPTVTMEALSGPVGLAADHLWRMGCTGSTVESCLDAVVWDVRARPGLLADHGLVGRVVTVGRGGVHVVLVVGDGS